MTGSLAGRVAIVTGAGRGIGRAEAMCLATEGAKVVVNDIGVTTKGDGPHSRAPADAVVAEIREAGGEAVASYDDVSRPDRCGALVAAALETFGRIDILVNNAGQEGSRMIWKMTDERWDEVIRTHLYGSFYLIKRVAPHFRAQSYGRIVNTSSDSGQGWPGEANYSAAKEGIIGLTKTVARELAAFGVTCNAIRPRAWTRMPADGAFVKKAEELRTIGDAQSRAFADSFTAIRSQTPEQIAPFVAYLASEAAALVSGQVFTIGGRAITIQQTIPSRTIFAEESWTVESLTQLFPRTLGAGLTPPTINTPPDACEFHGA